MIAIIGSGPAGVSCALYLARANIPVSIFTNHKSSLLKATKIENYYGTGPISGKELYEKGIQQLKELHIPIYEEEVFHILVNNSFTIQTEAKEYQAEAIILATGSSLKKLNIPNLANLEGKGVSYCATCDGFFFRNKKVAVIGSKAFALEEASYLKNIAQEVYLLTNGDSLANDSFSIIETPIQSILGEDKVQGVQFIDNFSIEVDGVFIANHYPDSNILARKIGIQTKENKIIVNDNLETNIPNLFACGDAIDGIKQVSKAVEDGRKVAFFIMKRFSK